MSDHIPIEIQSEIIKRLPTKSVVQFRSVSKLWKFLIDSSEFITSYHTCTTQPKHHLFITYKSAKQLYYVSIADDDTFPNQNSFLTVPQSVRLLKFIFTVHSVNGLLCFYGAHLNVFSEKMAVLWNPSVQKTVSITISNPLRPPNGHTFIGFGVSPITSDPKLVRINVIGLRTVLNWEVEVFTLSARVWKSVSNIPPDFRTCHLIRDYVSVEGVVYWRAYHNFNIPGVRSNFIISFDLMSDEFGEVSLPGRLVCSMIKFTMSKVYESLGLFEYYTEDMTRFCDVWIMKDKSFNKIFSIKAPVSWVFYRVLELRHNGEAIVEAIDNRNSFSLEAYEPSSGRSSGLGINGTFDSLSVNSYMETLLLLDEPYSIIY